MIKNSINQKINIDGIPYSMTTFEQWLVRIGKVPYSVKNDKCFQADPTDRNNFLYLDSAIKAVETHEELSGIGFAFDGCGFVGIDIDHCFNNGKFNQLASEILELCKDTYVEFSLSGDGIHIIYWDTDTNGFTGRKNPNLGLEVYADKHYFAITGNRVPNTSDNFNVFNGLTNQLLDKYFYNDNFALDFHSQLDIIKKHDIEPEFADDELINIIRLCNDNKFNRLFYNGDTSEYAGDDSSADMALMMKLAFYTNGNSSQMERLFNKSKLGERDKWQNRQDYRQRTIANSINQWILNGSNGFKPQNDFALDFHSQLGIVNNNATPVEQIDPLLLPNDILSKLMFLNQTDYGNAERLVTAYGQNRIFYLADNDRWLNFNGIKWIQAAKSSNSSVTYLIAALARQLKSFAQNKVTQYQHEYESYTQSQSDNDNKVIVSADSLDADTKKKAEQANLNKSVAESVVKLCRRLEKRTNIDNSIYLAKGIDKIRITVDDLNNHKLLFNCKNGVIDLESGKLYPHDSKLLFTQCAGIDYRKDYYSDVFDNFIKSVLPDDEIREALLMFLGYCLTGLVREDKALFIHGDGRNGKGSLIAALLRCLGDFATTLKIDALLQSPRWKDGDAATPEFNKLLYSRLAIADEIPHGRQLDVPKFKHLTGGDAIPVRRLHEESSIIHPTHKLILSGNTLPELKDTREVALIERLIVIKFEQSFLGDKCDPLLRENLLKPDSLSGLLSVLVDYCMKWLKVGKLIEPSSVKAFKSDYLEENDTIGEFIHENCDFAPDSSIRLTDFIDRVKRSNTIVGMSRKAIVDAVKKIGGITYKRYIGGVYYFFGIKWKPDKQNDNMNVPPPDDCDCPY